MRTTVLALLVVLSACGLSTERSQGLAASDDGADALKLPSALEPSDFQTALDQASIRSLQTWLDDGAFEVKWADMLSTPIAFFGGADSAYYADLAPIAPPRFPGSEALCHGDPKYDNFGWTVVNGKGLFSDNDFDDASFCPVAMDALRYLVATDLAFSDPSLDDAALEAYVNALGDPTQAVAVDASTEPDWVQAASKGLAKSTQGDALVLGAGLVAVTAEEREAVLGLAAEDPRFAPRVLDVAREPRTTGGSAGMRRYWLLTEDASGGRTIVELKELSRPGPEFGRHDATLDGPDRFDVLKTTWWGTDDAADHFMVGLLGARFMARNHLLRANVDPSGLTAAQVKNLVQAEASLLALEHGAAWGKVAPERLSAWLKASAATLTQRWRAAYRAAGGK